ncbi:MAG: hypothetical protein FWD06_03200 [Oscillospiraceae bacterium]|nr:hypothetical protein [Oscillospiraceae bacterium]
MQWIIIGSALAAFSTFFFGLMLNIGLHFYLPFWSILIVPAAFALYSFVSLIQWFLS